MMTGGGKGTGPTVWIVVPAYNESRTVVSIIDGLRRHGFPDVLVVDDGSGDGTGALAAAAGAHVVRHPLNRGLGGAIGTGIRAAAGAGADVIATFDADGQHAPDDVARVIAPVLTGEADLVIGVRSFRRGEMPWHRRVANVAANVATRLIFGVRCSDSQSGLRALSREAALALDLQAQRMEVSSEILHKSAIRGLRVREVPVRAIYTTYSLSKGQGVVMGLRTLARLILLRLGEKAP